MAVTGIQYFTRVLVWLFIQSEVCIFTTAALGKYTNNFQMEIKETIFYLIKFD